MRARAIDAENPQLLLGGFDRIPMMRRLVVGALSVGGAVLVGCTAKNPDFCKADTECDDPAKPFCDVSGEFAESGHTPNICTARPAGCSIERCGCDAGTGLSCDLDQLTVCNADGHSSSVETCALGCSTEPRCLTFEPSNGLGPALEMAASEPDVVLPPGTRIDTDLGTVTTASGSTVSVRSAEVSQQGSVAIRAFVARSFTIDGVVVRGQHPVALVAADSILIRGRFDARATGTNAGPGALDSPAACAGEGYQVDLNTGTGGGGGATAGGDGGGLVSTSFPAKRGGASTAGFEPLVGGCRGGTASSQATLAVGGAGGGGVQLVAGNLISLSDNGLIDVGAGGGQDRAGGGSGGTIIVESARVEIAGTAAGLVGNGGSGGGCGMGGADGSQSSVVASAPKCTHSSLNPGTASAGNGGTVLVPPESAETWGCAPNLFCPASGGGGGGSVGRAWIRTKSGDVVVTGAPLLGIAITKAMIPLR